MLLLPHPVRDHILSKQPASLPPVWKSRNLGSGILEIKKIIEPVSMTTFNSVLINFYRDGKDRVAWHSDDEKELGKKPIIGSVSFGAERKFKLRHKKYRENGLRSDIMLKHGSFLLMSGSTQSHWAHEIPRTAKPLGPRVNLTYRKII